MVNGEGYIYNKTMLLRRNYADLPFPLTMTAEDLRENARRIEFVFLDRDYVKTGDGDESTEVLFSENDHYLLPVMQTNERKPITYLFENQFMIIANGEDGMLLSKTLGDEEPEIALSFLKEQESRLNLNHPFAAMKDFGFLTARPRQCGSGFQYLILVHLPLLTLVQRDFQGLNAALESWGCTFEPLTGGTDNPSSLYRVYNLFSQEEDETNIVNSVFAAAQHLIQREKTLFESIESGGMIPLKDQVYRAYGLMRYALTLNLKEFQENWSRLRLGSLYQWIQIDLKKLDAFFLQGYLQQLQDDPKDMNIKRAEMTNRFMEDQNGYLRKV